MMTNMNNEAYMNNGSLSPPMPRTVGTVYSHSHAASAAEFIAFIVVLLIIIICLDGCNAELDELDCCDS